MDIRKIAGILLLSLVNVKATGGELSSAGIHHSDLHVIVNSSHLTAREINISPESVRVIQDPESILSVEDLISEIDELNYITLSSFNNIIERKGTWWGVFDLKNELNEDMPWIFYPGRADLIELFLIKEGKVINYQKAGFKAKHNDPNRTIDLVTSFYEMEVMLPAQSQLTFIIKLSNEVNFLQPAFGTEFVQFQDYLKGEQEEELINLVLYIMIAGGLFLMGSYILAVYFNVREKVYFYYSIYLLELSLTHLIASALFAAYFITSQRTIYNIFSLSMGGAALLYGLFIREFFKSSFQSERFFRLFKYCLIFVCFLVTVKFIAGFYMTEEAYITLTMIPLLISGLLLIPFLIIGSKRSGVNGKFIFYGTCWLIVGISIITFLQFLGYNNTILNGVVVTVSIFGEVVIFSIGLSYKMKQEQELKQQAQNKLIEQLKENEKLQTKVNRELEQKVKERTEEIMAQAEEIAAQRDALEVEKNKSDNLLLNILPQSTAFELKETGKAVPRHYEKVSVLFTDFRNFTKVAEQYAPEDLLKELNTCFFAFDEIVEKYKLEKIKTIGDAYMCAAGVPVASEEAHLNIIKAGLEMRDFINNYKTEREKLSMPCWEVRLGIHTGPVIAGVVGKNKFAYDIWGDTVNIASRMESSGEPGKLNISGYTYALIGGEFNCTYRGKVDAKNKGKIDMYFVEGVKEGVLVG
jgi:class 3 adenylate cyclase